MQNWPDGVTSNQIDDCLMVQVRRGANVDLDHFLVLGELRARNDRAQIPSVRPTFPENFSTNFRTRTRQSE